MDPNNTPTETQETPDVKKEKVIFSTPLAIVLAGVFIAGAIVFTNIFPQSQGLPRIAIRDIEAPRAVDASDHIRGSMDAPVVLIEYSDTECPFCKRFHETIQELQSVFGEDVAWVYRHFPLTRLHKKAETEAHALECVSELSGEKNFWSYTDTLYEITPSNDGLDLALLPKLATDLGIPRRAFDECMKSERYQDRIESDLNDAISSDGRGTPYSILVFNEPLGKRAVVAIMEIGDELIAGGADPNMMSISSDNTFVTIGGAFPVDLMTDIINAGLER